MPSRASVTLVLNGAWQESASGSRQDFGKRSQSEYWYATLSSLRLHNYNLICHGMLSLADGDRRSNLAVMTRASLFDERPREPETGANVFRRSQTQPDPVGPCVLVRGSPSDSSQWWQTLGSSMACTRSRGRTCGRPRRRCPGWDAVVAHNQDRGVVSLLGVPAADSRSLGHLAEAVVAGVRGIVLVAGH